MSAETDVIIVGASARAAAFSALRAGLRPWCADLFADVDLQARCRAQAVADYPEGLVHALDDAPAAPLLYVGALENRPGLVRRLARRRPLWGNDAAVLRRVRAPAHVQAVLRQHGLACPEVVTAHDSAPREGRWLLKPVRSAGGAGIRFWTGGPWSGRRRAAYLQEYIEGESCAAVFAGDGRRARLLGVTRQLVGAAWLHAAPFHYCGSVGPLRVTPAVRTALGRLGDALAGAFGLRGLFGVDCVLRDDVPYPVEVNPRYTASVEVLEYATGLAALRWHRRAFVPGDPSPDPAEEAAQEFVGKAVFYAPREIHFPTHGPWSAVLHDIRGIEALPAFADVPAAGQRVPARRPVLTLFARAAGAEACQALLRDVAADLDGQLARGG